jgi:hypothetical protein
MKYVRTSLKKHFPKILFALNIFIFGIISGIIYYFKQDQTIKDSLLSLNNIFASNVFSWQNCLFHFFTLLFIAVMLFTFLGLIFILFLLFFEGISLGFIISLLFSIYKWKFLSYFLVYFILIKAIYFILLFIIYLNSIFFLKNYLKYFKTKKYTFFIYFKRIIILIFLVLTNDLLIYFVFNKVLIFLLG